MPFQKGHKIYKGSERGWIKKGQHFSVLTEFKKGHPKPINSYKFPKGNKIGIGNTNVMGKRWKIKEEKRKNMSRGMGEKSPSWKGGITPENVKIRTSLEMNLWKKAVFQRDNFTCQKYGTSESGTLNAHHINNFADFPELRFAIDNGITLSKKAHQEFHKKYGNKNNTKEQLEEFLHFKE